jgi:hypothetical protein
MRGGVPATPSQVASPDGGTFSTDRTMKGTAAPRDPARAAAVIWLDRTPILSTRAEVSIEAGKIL